MEQRLFYRKFNTLDFETDYSLPFEKSLHHGFTSGVCTNCGGNFSRYLKPLDAQYLYNNPKLTGKPEIKTNAIWLFICYSCGWWQIAKKGYINGNGFVHDSDIYHSILERIDENSDRAKVIDYRNDLRKNWESRINLSPSEGAELVRGILQDHYKCDVIHVKGHINTPDGGIDLFVGHDGTKIHSSAQIKWRTNGKPEGVYDVRAFVGALTIQGHNEGTFITSAERFTPKVHMEQKMLHENSHIKLNLVNSSRLLELVNATTPYDKPILPLDLKEESYWIAGDHHFTTLQVLMGLPGKKWNDSI